MEKKTVTHVIFDMDGLLLDTERLYTEATQNICDLYGKKYTWDIKKEVMGKKEHVSAKMIVDTLELPITVEEYLTEIHKEYDRLFPTVPFLPGAEKLVRHLHKHNVPIAVVTGSNTHSFELKTVNHKDFFSLFHHHVLCGDDPEVKHGKPHPDAFEVGAKRFEDSPDHSKERTYFHVMEEEFRNFVVEIQNKLAAFDRKLEQGLNKVQSVSADENDMHDVIQLVYHQDYSMILVFEDAMNGVEAAHAAGMPCVWVPHAEQDKTVLEGKTELIIDSLEEFQPEMFGLPPYDS